MGNEESVNRAEQVRRIKRRGWREGHLGFKDMERPYGTDDDLEWQYEIAYREGVSAAPGAQNPY